MFSNIHLTPLSVEAVNTAALLLAMSLYVSIEVMFAGDCLPMEKLPKQLQ